MTDTLTRNEQVKSSSLFVGLLVFPGNDRKNPGKWQDASAPERSLRIVILDYAAGQVNFACPELDIDGS